MSMKTMITVFSILTITASMAFAQSSGNFSYGTSPQNETACVMDNNGVISGGETCEESCTIDALGNSTCTTPGGTCNGHAVAGIKTSAGAGNIFVIRPSAVIGLLTDVTVSSNQKGSSTGAVSSSALAGVDFKVTVKGPNGDVKVIPSDYITYDSRYIQISTNLFQALASQCLLIGGAASSPLTRALFRPIASTSSREGLSPLSRPVNTLSRRLGRAPLGVRVSASR